MANISYPKFGKVKTIVLPINTSLMTFDEYKEAYGIDLDDLFILSDNQYILKNEYKNVQILLLDSENYFSGNIGLKNILRYDEVESGSTKATIFTLNLGVDDGDIVPLGGLAIFYDSSSEESSIGIFEN